MAPRSIVVDAPISTSFPIKTAPVCGILTHSPPEVENTNSFFQPIIKPLIDKPVGVHSRYSNMDFVHTTFGWAPKVSLQEGMRRVYEASVDRM
jgi:hypothetical protein